MPFDMFYQHIMMSPIQNIKVKKVRHILNNAIYVNLQIPYEILIQNTMVISL